MRCSKPHSNRNRLTEELTLDPNSIVAAVLANEFIFPARSRGLFLDTMAEALDDLTKLYLAVRGPFQVASPSLALTFDPPVRRWPEAT